jgi:hypothetical protein
MISKSLPHADDGDVRDALRTMEALGLLVATRDDPLELRWIRLSASHNYVLALQDRWPPWCFDCFGRPERSYAAGREPQPRGYEPDLRC